MESLPKQTSTTSPTTSGGSSYNQKDIQAKIDLLGYTEQNQVLVELGFTNLKKNLMELIQFNGDPTEVVNHILLKQVKKETKYDDMKIPKEKEKEKKGSRKKDDQIEGEILKLGFQKQNEELINQGYTKVRANLKALKKFNGNIQQALEFLQQKKHRKHGKDNFDTKENTKKDKDAKKDKNAKIEAALKELGFEEQYKMLIEAGYMKPRQNLKVLTKTGGNAQDAINLLKLKEEKRKYKLITKEGNQENSEKSKEFGKKFGDFEILKKSYDKMPEYIATIYLDGNNMLFVNDSIRKMVLSRNKPLAEKTLASLAMKFASFMTKTINWVLIFDQTNFTYEDTITNVSGKTSKFVVCSARPKYQTSDDALVDWVTTQALDTKTTLFVTSDKELGIRLNQKGCTEIMSTGSWFKLAQQTIGADIYNSIVSC